MRSPARAVLGAALVAVAGTAATAAVAAKPDAPTVTTVRLDKDIAAGIPISTDLGAAPAAQAINVTVGLQRPDSAGEDAYIKALYDAKSPTYHQYLTPATFAARFGVAEASWKTAVAYGTAHGMTLQYADPEHDQLTFGGTVAQAQSTFGVSIHRFHAKTTNDYLNTDYLSNTAGPLVPAGIGVVGVLGLSDERVAKVDTPNRTTVKPMQTDCAAGQCLGLTTPQDLWATYDQPSANMGQGAQLAIFGEGQTDDVIADLRQFEKEFGLRAIPVTVVHTDGPKADYSDDAGSEEWNIDTQSSTGMAPLADREVLYFGSALTDASVLGVFNTWANDATGPMNASASYGECEEIPDAGTGAVGTVQGAVPATAVSAGAAYTLMSEQTLKAAVAMGKTLFSSSGDTGSGCPVLPTSTNGAAPQGVPQPNYPADSPNAVSVGGTVLYTTGGTPDKRAIENSWNYTGGGTSFIFAEPDYQKPVGATIVGQCVGVPGGGAATPGTTCRGVPDVAMQSGDIATNGYAITVKGAADQPGGGTSLASPMMEGTWARIQAAAGNKAGFANESFYKIGTDPTKDAAAFFDVGGTTNSQPGTSVATDSFGPYTNMPRSAVDPSGWDYLSGLGVPDIAVLMQDIAGRTTPVTTAVTPDALPLPTVPNGCLPSGIVTDPTGDATEIVTTLPAGVNQPDLDITRAFISYNKTAQTLVFNTTVADLGDGTEGQNFRYEVSYGGTQYNIEASRTAATGSSFSLLTVGDTSTDLADVTGTFDAATNTVSVVLPIATFNSAAKPKTPLAEGDSLTGQTLLAQRDTGALTLTADEAGTTCPFIIGGDAVGAAKPVVVTKPVVKAKKPAAAKKKVTAKKTTGKVSQGGGTLAYTGLSALLPLGALLLLGVGLVVARRRRA